MVPRNRPKTITGVVLGLALCSCAAGASPSSGEPLAEEVRRIRGEALAGKEGYGLVLCGSERQRSLALSPSAKVFLDRFLQTGHKPEFFLDAWAREKNGKLEIIAIERAHTEGQRCDAAPDPAQFVASGTEPFWSLQLSPSGGVLQRPDQPPLQFGTVATKIDAGYVWKSTAPAATVKITPGYCEDGMAAAASAWQATISLGDLRLAGCAHRGELPLP
jgi:uncharacterized membrane protein